MKTWPTLLAAAVLFIGGSARAVQADGLDALSVCLLAAALILLGAWIRDEDGDK